MRIGRSLSVTSPSLWLRITGERIPMPLLLLLVESVAEAS